MGLLRWFLVCVFLGLAPAGIAAAQVSVSFHGHDGSQVRGGYIHLPHAFVHFSGTIEATGQPVDQTVGFTARNPGPHLLLFSGPGVLHETDAAYRADSSQYASLIISDETYFAMQARLDNWRTGRGSTYNLNRRNCIHFVAEMARMAGLQTPPEDTLSPNGFLKDMVTLNPQLTQVAAPPEPQNLMGAPAAF